MEAVFPRSEKSAWDKLILDVFRKPVEELLEDILRTLSYNVQSCIRSALYIFAEPLIVDFLYENVTEKS